MSTSETPSSDVNRPRRRRSPRSHFAVTRFFQKRFKLSSAPNNVLNTVESASSTSPPRSPFGRHPHKRVEFAVAGFGERMRFGQIDGLAAQDVTPSSSSRGDRIVRQVLVETEVRDAFEPAPSVEVAIDGQRRDLSRPVRRLQGAVRIDSRPGRRDPSSASACTCRSAADAAPAHLRDAHTPWLARSCRWKFRRHGADREPAVCLRERASVCTASISSAEASCSVNR